MTEGQMVKSRLDGQPELTEIERTIAHGKLLLKALYADHPGQRLAARRPSRCCWHSRWRLRRCLRCRSTPFGGIGPITLIPAWDRP